MYLQSGAKAVSLSPVRYQFPAMEPTDDGWDWDVNWLMIRGDVRDGDVTWGFTDPCLTTREAWELSTWLRCVAAGEGTATLRFTEMHLSFSCLGGTGDEVQLVVSFAQESSPPGADDETRYGFGHPVALAMTRADLQAAADEWDRALAAFPER